MSKLSGEFVIEVKCPFEFPNPVPDKKSFFQSDPKIISKFFYRKKLEQLEKT